MLCFDTFTVFMQHLDLLYSQRHIAVLLSIIFIFINLQEKLGFVLLSFTICNTVALNPWVCVYLQRSHPELLTTPPLSYLRQVVDEPLEDVGGIQVTVVVHVDVDHALGIWGGRRNVLEIYHILKIQEGDNTLLAEDISEYNVWICRTSQIQQQQNHSRAALEQKMIHWPVCQHGATFAKPFLNVMGHLFIGYCHWLSQQELVIFDERHSMKQLKLGVQLLSVRHLVMETCRNFTRWCLSHFDVQVLTKFDWKHSWNTAHVWI